MSGTPRLSSAAVRPLPALADDPARADLGPLDWLDAAIDGARVVAVGESAHFNAVSYRLRHLVLRHLVERHGFTAYAMESGFVEGRAVDAWLGRPAGTAGDADLGAVLARGTTSLMGMFTEQRRLLQWMREARARGTRVRFYGVDTPGSNVSLLPVLDLVEAYLTANDPQLRIEPDVRDLAEATAASSVFVAQAALAAYANLPADRKDALTAGLSLLLARLRARRPAHRRSDAPNDEPATGTAFDVVEHALELAIAWDAYRRDMTVNVRDLAVMVATHDEPFGVDLRALDATDRATLVGVRTQRSGPFLCPIDPLAAYDVIMHLPHVTAARPDPAAVDAAPADVAAVFRSRPD